MALTQSGKKSQHALLLAGHNGERLQGRGRALRKRRQHPGAAPKLRLVPALHSAHSGGSGDIPVPALGFRLGGGGGFADFAGSASAHTGCFRR